MTFHDQLIVLSYEFIGASSLWYVTDKFCDRKCCDSVDTFFICHVTPQNPVIEGLCNFMNGSSSWYVNTLSSLATIGTVVVEI